MTVRSKTRPASAAMMKLNGSANEKIALIKPARCVEAGQVKSETQRIAAEAEREDNVKTKTGAKEVLHHVTRIGADGNHFPVRHVDDPHQTEGDGKPQRHDQQNRSQAHTVKDRAEDIDPLDMHLEGADGLVGRLGDVFGDSPAWQPGA